MSKQCKGFTLIELMVTLAVAAIVLGIAVPSFNTQILNNRSIALGEDFATALNFVRSEAVKRGGRVSLCASNDGATCTGAWVEGFIAFVDDAATDTAGAPVVANVLRVWEPQPNGAEISVQRAGVDVGFIRYTGLGTLARIGGNNTITIESQMAHCTNNSARRTSVGLSGLVTIEGMACTE